MTTETTALTIADVIATYRDNLARAVTERPDDYPPGAGDRPAEYAALTVDRLGPILARGLVRRIYIDSRAFRLTAKAYGIPNTYKAWEPFLAALD